MTRTSILRSALVVAVGFSAGCSVAPRLAKPAVGAGAPPATVAPIGAVRRQPTDLMLVRRGELSAVVDDLAPPLERSRSLTASLGGYIAAESRDEGSVSVSMRVPEPKLDVALDSLSQLGTVTSRHVSSQDVTEEAIDVEARIQSLTAERDQLRQLLGKAVAINDVFTIERELARVQGDIDSLQHRLDHLHNTSALAQLDAQFKKRQELGPVSKFFAAIGHGIGRLFVR
ncbi:MAG TPA: DUF4349 domain-containing protein [Gemmatimonadaceae bacterium]|nr:DUF4349 domain-containing protein [Gemmatimonadaceae bacterium]